MAKRILYLIRHGEYEDTTPEKHPSDGPLTEKGKAQALLTASRLQNIPIQAIYTSNLLRSSETGQYIASLFPELNLLPLSELRECVPCLPVQIEERATPAQQKAASSGIHKARQAFKSFFKKPDDDKDQYEVIVSHGNLIRYLLAKTIHAPCESWIHISIHHASISEVHIRESGFQKLVRLNDTAHFPDNLRSTG